MIYPSYQVKKRYYVFCHQYSNFWGYFMSKGTFFHWNITGKNNFQAITGWLKKFENKFGIYQLTVCGESLKWSLWCVAIYKKLQNIVQERKLSPDQVYIADESGLFLKVLLWMPLKPIKLNCMQVIGKSLSLWKIQYSISHKG